MKAFNSRYEGKKCEANVEGTLMNTLDITIQLQEFPKAVPLHEQEWLVDH